MASENVDPAPAKTEASGEDESRCNFGNESFMKSEGESDESDDEEELFTADGLENRKVVDETVNVIHMNESDYDSSHSYETLESSHDTEETNLASLINRESVVKESENSCVVFSSDEDDDSHGSRKSCRSKQKKFRCEKCGRDFKNRANMARHLATHDFDTPQCNVCGKNFARRSHLREHMTVHTKAKLFKCNICSKGYSRSSTLKVHMITHSGERPFKCDLCDKSFTQRSVLKTHMTVHSGEKRHQCHMCDMKFKQRSGLAEHIASHSVDNPMRCKICDKHHAFKSGLIRHMKTHHHIVQGEEDSRDEIKPDPLAANSSKLARISTLLTIAADEEKKKLENESKPFKCSVCGNGYSRNYSLTMHMRAHTGVKSFKCDICGKEFARKSVLKNHMVVHSGEKRFKCTFCEKEFTQQAGLTEHMVKHNTVSTFSCIICGKKTAFKSSYIKHMRSHQSEGRLSEVESRMLLDSFTFDELRSKAIQSGLDVESKPKSSNLEDLRVEVNSANINSESGDDCVEGKAESVSDCFEGKTESILDSVEVKDSKLSLLDLSRYIKEEKKADMYANDLLYIKEEKNFESDRESEL